MSKLADLGRWFKKNILRMGDNKPTVDISKEYPVLSENDLKEEKKQSDSHFPLKVKLIDTTLTVVTALGKIFTKLNATPDDYLKVSSCESIDEVEAFLITDVSKKEKIEELKKEKVISKSFQILSESDLFIVDEKSVYMNMEGIKHRSLPLLLIEKFAGLILAKNSQSDEAVKDEFDKAIETLIRFWSKCCLCPDAQSAEDLYGFLEKHKMKIDEHGNFYTYRRVVRKNKGTEFDKELVDFISSAYNKVKALWKKKPINFEIYKSSKGLTLANMKDRKREIKAERIGNLEELFLSLENMDGNRFTDKQTGKYDYRVGTVISMPRQQGDNNNAISCSYGFHVASKEYDYSGFGDTPILTIVNPMDVLAVPKGEIGKMRVCRWFFAMILDPKEEHILDDSRFDVRHLGDVFESKCLENLGEHVAKIFAEEKEANRHIFNLASMSKDEVNDVVTNLEKIKNDLRERVQKVI